MNTDFLMHENGLNQAGQSQLPLDELLRQLSNAKAIEAIDSAVNGVGQGMVRLSIRREGTFITLLDRDSATSSGLEAASAWLHALERHAVNPCDSTKRDLQEADKQLGQSAANCLRSTIKKICRSKAIEIPLDLDGKIIQIAIPHEATVAASLNEANHSSDDKEDERYVTIKEIHHCIETTSTSGIVALISPGKKKTEIRAGIRILVKLNKKQAMVSRLQRAKPRDQHG